MSSLSAAVEDCGFYGAEGGIVAGDTDLEGLGLDTGGHLLVATRSRTLLPG